MFKNITVLIASIALTGCATIVGSKSQIVSITTDPIGASVEINDKYYGTSPVTASIRLKDNLLSKASKKQILENHRDFKELSLEDYHKETYLKEIEKVEKLRNIHAVKILRVEKNNYQTEEYVIGGSTNLKKTPNRSLCIFDSVMSVFTLGLPMLVNHVNHSCFAIESANIKMTTLQQAKKNKALRKKALLDYTKVKNKKNNDEDQYKISDPDNPLLNPEGSRFTALQSNDSIAQKTALGL